MIYKDRYGNPLVVGDLTGEAAWRSIYGPGSGVVRAAPAPCWRVVELWDSGDNVAMDCIVEVRGGYPDGVTAILEWPDGENEGAFKGPDVQEVLFFAKFWPPDGGPYTVYIRDQQRVSDEVVGLGLLDGTNHRHASRIVFEKVNEPEPPEPPAPEPPTPPPPVDEVAYIRELLAQAIALIEEADERLAAWQS